MSNVITNDALAKIAIAKNLLKEYKTAESDRVVYLTNGTEFQIYLKNPYQTHLGIKISVNNKSMGDNMLVLRPGQSFWLDRFINENKKLLFSTYDVENTQEMKYATAQNGKVTIQFYHEKERDYNNIVQVKHYNNNNNWDNYCLNLNDVKLNCDCEIANTVSTQTYYNSPSSTFTSSGISGTLTGSTGMPKTLRREVDRSATAKVDTNLSLETGRVEKGGYSDQKFDRCDIDFDYWAFKTENIQILPSSRKQIRPEETRRKYCCQCGKKVGPKDRFCSNCGAKLD